MSERKECVRCSRNIDRNAKLCPFCTWDQAATPPPRVVTPIVTEETSRASAGPDRLKSVLHEAPGRIKTAVQTNRVVWAVGGGALLVIIFVIGALVHGVEPDEPKTQTTTTVATN